MYILTIVLVCLHFQNAIQWRLTSNLGDEFIVGVLWSCSPQYDINTLRPRQNGRRFADDAFICIFLNENVRISIKISLKFVPKGPINNIPALVQIMAWRRSGNKPLSEPMMVSLLTHVPFLSALLCNMTADGKVSIEAQPSGHIQC